MLTQHEVRKQLDTIADEVAQPAGLYYELYTRLYSQRVRRWIRSAPHPEAVLIQRIVENDPDYLTDSSLTDKECFSDKEPAGKDSVDTMLHSVAPVKTMPAAAQQPLLFNPAWDMDY
jgi:hypothetical protein